MTNKYSAMIERSYQYQKNDECPADSKLEFVAMAFFDIYTYENSFCRTMARHCLDVCMAITNRNTFDYIADNDKHEWYLIMTHTPFIKDRIDWGTSIRGAWWNCTGLFIESCYLFNDKGAQILRIDFSTEEWGKFIHAINDFCNDKG